MTSLIGRDRDVDGINQALDGSRLVTLVGTGGVGKTRLADEALPLNGQTNNRLISLVFGAFKNGTVTIDSQSIASGATYTPPANATKVTLVVDRGAQGASQPTTIPFDAMDVCGTWPSLVGGGTAAGF